MSPRSSGETRETLLAFGAFRFDPDSGQLFDAAGEVVALQPQPARLLALFVSRPGERVGRSEIRKYLWGESAVDVEAGVSYAVRRIRKALGDSPETPRYLETLPRRGYRFIADVAPASASPEEADPPSIPSESKVTGPRWIGRVSRKAVLLAATVLGITLGLTRFLPVESGAADCHRSAYQGQGEAVPSRDVARDAFLRGQYLLSRSEGDRRETAAVLFRRALSADPSFAPAYLALESAERQTAPPEERRDLLLRAAQLEPALVGIASGFGWLALLDERDPARALELFGEDLSRDPGWIDALHGTALAAAAAGHWNLALDTLEKALVLAPAETALQGDAAQILFWAGRPERAMVQVGRALELAPDEGSIRWATLTQQVAVGDWRQAAEQAASLMPADRRARFLDETAGQAPRVLVERFLAGVEEFHRVEIEQPLPAWNLAEIELALGRLEPALEELARAAAEDWPELVFLGVDPRWDLLRGEPRFRQLLTSLGIQDHRSVEFPMRFSQT